MSKIIKQIIFLVMLVSFCAFNLRKIEAAEGDLDVRFKATGKRTHLACSQLATTSKASRSSHANKALIFSAYIYEERIMIFNGHPAVCRTGRSYVDSVTRTTRRIGVSKGSCPA